jgi:hypothetical protein
LQNRNAGAVRLFAHAFSAYAKLADDLKASHRYDAACCAALAAAGQGTDAGQLDDKERAGLRQQALAWLRADLELWSKRLQDGQTIRKILQHWQNDNALAGVRDAAALMKLPAAEREAWRKLWADVAELLKNASDVKEGMRLPDWGQRGFPRENHAVPQAVQPNESAPRPRSC